MDIFRVVDSAIGKIRTIYDAIDQDRELEGKLRGNLLLIENEMRMLNAHIKQSEGKIQEEVQQEWVQQLQELAYDIEDFIDRLKLGSQKPKHFIHRAVPMMLRIDPRPEHLRQIDSFKERVMSLQKHQPTFEATKAGVESGGNVRPLRPVHQLIGIDEPEEELLQLLSLDDSQPEQKELKVISILGSTGLGKTTLARQVYDKRDVVKQFQAHAWVESSACKDAASLLNAILHKLSTNKDGAQGQSTSEAPLLNQYIRDKDIELFSINEKSTSKTPLLYQYIRDKLFAFFSKKQKLTSEASSISHVQQLREDVTARLQSESILEEKEESTSEASSISDVQQLIKHVAARLQSKRYLIVIDDLKQIEVWRDIEPAFPKNKEGSRVIVATSIRSVATAFDWGGRVYKMQCLGEEHSQRLFWSEVSHGGIKRTPNIDEGSKRFIDSCDGLPLALVITAQYLHSRRNDLYGGQFEIVDLKLRDVLQKTELNRALEECYNSLPDHGHRLCLLSVSIFPRGHRINRKSLLRRWLAEGLVVSDNQLNSEYNAQIRFGEFIDRSIIEAVDIGKELETEQCRVHGVMLEFISRKSESRNFITCIGNDQITISTNGRVVRRLSIYNSTAEGRKRAEEMSVSHVRSLTVLNSDVPNLHNYEALRVLDIEHCKGIEENVVNSICELIFLKYLSLRDTDIRLIPSKIKRLMYLETLDLRETEVETLPLEVLKLPHLFHLFGKFELPPELSDGKRQMLLQDKCALQVLSGFVMKDKQAFEHVLRHMTRLKKVKIWRNTKAAPGLEDLTNHLVECIESRLEQSRRCRALESLSIDFDGLSLDFVAALARPAFRALKSLKLRGTMSSLPPFLASSDRTNKLRKLHLWSTGLSWEDLSGLQNLQNLLYLTLQEEHRGSLQHGIFAVKSGGFPSLRWLCFQVNMLPTLEFEEGSMPVLNDLHLLCPTLSSPSELLQTIKNLDSLKDVVLNRAVGEIQLTSWKKAARGHKNRPNVSMQQQ